MKTEVYECRCDDDRMTVEDVGEGGATIKIGDDENKVLLSHWQISALIKQLEGIVDGWAEPTGKEGV